MARPVRRPVQTGEMPYGRGDTVVGIFQASARRGAYLVPETAGWSDIRIPPTGMGAALHGDRVEVEVFKAKPGRQPSGHVVKILHHANKQILGKLVRAGKYCTVFPKNKRIHRIIQIPRRFDLEEVPEEAWVIVEVKHWTERPEEPLTGKLVEVLGTEEEKGLPILLLVREGGVAIEFSKEAEAEAHALDKAAAPHMEKGRRDLRHERVCTIDPATAKDFDDAISLHGVDEHGWKIGVHIADVSHFVKPGMAIDDEAYERATSIYPVDRVIPMLPEALSNRLCSLRQNEDKLTMTAFFTVDRHGAVRDVDLCNSAIRSRRRFAYEEVQGLFDAVDREAGIKVEAERPRPVVEPDLEHDLLHIREAARALRRARFNRGALNLELPETEILFDADGRVCDLRRREHFEAHELVEELMIAANEAVARELERRGYPTLYRVHDEPDESKLRMVGPVLGRLGIPLPARGGISREELQRALEAAHKHPAGTIIQRWLLRTMMRAKYQPENVGHFGLASKSYLHFTSPIRRYPDLVVHRVVKAMLAKESMDSETMIELAAKLPLWGRHTSQREERSQRIEWDAEELLGLEFMRRYIGDIFDGFISGTMGAGFFVELSEWPVEGFVPIRQVDDDYYEFDDQLQLWRGRRTGRVYSIGDPVTVLIERIDVLAGQMDLVLLKRKTTKRTSGKTGRGKKERPRRSH
ncbi:ribonuclease R [bacterium]|nr:ribonuclease R [bacterium]